MRRLFTEHPDSVGESYFEHMGVAFSFGFKMLGAGCACVLHGLFPFMCTTTGSRTVNQLHDRMVTNRSRTSMPTAGQTSEAR